MSPSLMGHPGALEQATRLMADVQIGLELRGYPPRVVKAGVDRARGAALARVVDVSPSIRDQAFLDTLRAELRGVETWIKRELSIAV